MLLYTNNFLLRSAVIRRVLADIEAKQDFGL